jgi:hypothetical protein
MASKEVQDRVASMREALLQELRLPERMGSKEPQARPLGQSLHLRQ